MKKRDVIAGRYIIGQKVGQGSFGKVFSCRDRANPTLSLVIKCTNGQSNDKDMEDMDKQARTIQRLSHPNIVTFHNVLRSTQRVGYLKQRTTDIAFVMQKGQMSLYEYILKRKHYNQPLSEYDMKVFIYQATGLLNYFHSKKMAHRDIKPENLILMKEKPLMWKAIDFGLCIDLEHISCFGTDVAGTIAYMSPQMKEIYALRKQKSQVNSYVNYYKNDVYGMGMTILNLAAMSLQFGIESQLSKVKKYYGQKSYVYRTIVQMVMQDENQRPSAPAIIEATREEQRAKAHPYHRMIQEQGERERRAQKEESQRMRKKEEEVVQKRQILMSKVQSHKEVEKKIIAREWEIVAKEEKLGGKKQQVVEKKEVTIRKKEVVIEKKQMMTEKREQIIVKAKQTVEKKEIVQQQKQVVVQKKQIIETKQVVQKEHKTGIVINLESMVDTKTDIVGIQWFHPQLNPFEDESIIFAPVYIQETPRKKPILHKQDPIPSPPVMPLKIQEIPKIQQAVATQQMPITQQTSEVHLIPIIPITPITSETSKNQETLITPIIPETPVLLKPQQPNPPNPSPANPTSDPTPKVIEQQIFCPNTIRGKFQDLAVDASKIDKYNPSPEIFNFGSEVKCCLVVNNLMLFGLACAGLGVVFNGKHYLLKIVAGESQTDKEERITGIEIHNGTIWTSTSDNRFLLWKEENIVKLVSEYKSDQENEEEKPIEKSPNKEIIKIDETTLTLCEDKAKNSKEETRSLPDESKFYPQTQSQPKSQPKNLYKSLPHPIPHSQTQLQLKPQVQSKLQVQPKLQSSVQSAVEKETQLQVKDEVQSEAVKQIQSKVEQEVQQKIQQKVQQKIQQKVKQQLKPETQSKAQPQPKPQSPPNKLVPIDTPKPTIIKTNIYDIGLSFSGQKGDIERFTFYLNILFINFSYGNFEIRQGDNFQKILKQDFHAINTVISIKCMGFKTVLLTKPGTIIVLDKRNNYLKRFPCRFFGRDILGINVLEDGIEAVGKNGRTRISYEQKEISFEKFTLRKRVLAVAYRGINKLELFSNGSLLLDEHCVVEKVANPKKITFLSLSEDYILVGYGDGKLHLRKRIPKDVEEAEEQIEEKVQEKVQENGEEKKEEEKFKQTQKEDKKEEKKIEQSKEEKKDEENEEKKEQIKQQTTESKLEENKEEKIIQIKEQKDQQIQQQSQQQVKQTTSLQTSDELKSDIKKETKEDGKKEPAVETKNEMELAEGQKIL